MKRYIVISLLIVAAWLMQACNDDFLERQPLDEISNEVFWNNENDLRVYNNNIYDIARQDDNVPIMMGHDNNFDSHRFSIWYQDEFSDNMAPVHPRHNYYQEIRAGVHNPPAQANGNTGQWFGYRGWDLVRAVNFGLENYDKPTISDRDGFTGEEVRNFYVGEALLFRGWFYADKVQKFGDAPWIDRSLNIESEEVFAARTPREEVMANVLEDLNFATTSLPDDWQDGNAPGRLNRWCALLVKSRVCLFEGTWRKYHGGSDAEMWLQEAATAAREVMDNGPYTLYNTGDPENDYNAYHRILDLTGNPEVMYWRKYQLGVATNHVQSYWSNYSGGATKSMVDDYLCTDGLPITSSPLYQGDATIESTFENRDPRMRQTVLHPDDSEKYMYHNGDGRDYPRFAGMPGGRKTTTGYHIIKVYNAEDMIGKAFNTAESPAITLRFGEVLMNYAEAVAELGTITQADLDISVNLLRDRVAMPPMTMNPQMDPRYAGDGVTPLIAEIRRERRVELFMEGHRYNDLRRWRQGKKLEQPDLGIRWDDAAIARYEGANVATSVDPETGNTYINVYEGTDFANPVFDESKHYLWPIPLNTLAQNPNVGQNPGWGASE
ncbi:RagB/SusD family nutrient uptake outer membrane protein [Tunicatimonas pelagia]|uniref:RagB/SusD family nutrient uptake outer membrane protein n=1 Tax=Tunicatimonas pelagia TaxID=931531 RepID=UPI002665429E|nr:RagB/SusD family nutrient uptake outer membrane protein [Tunicatimonas pelagia]WKN42407.1 RagB/SusD family nutrient uptake outer membrane protein [Tunicatimonas pelagia]